MMEKRRDYQYVKTVPVKVAQEKQTRVSMRVLVTGATVTALCLQAWRVGLVLLVLLIVVNFMEKKTY